MRKHRFIIAGFFICAVAAGLFALGFAKMRPLENAIALKNFAPGTRIDYAVFSDDGQNIAAKETIGADGTFKLPAEKTQAMSGRSLRYDLNITPQNASRSYEVDLFFDHASRTFSAQAKGLQGFAPVTLALDGAPLIAHTDWAGKFENLSPFNFKGQTADNPKIFKLAFNALGRDIAADISNPLIIEVLIAPGGGRPPDHSWLLFGDPKWMKPNPENNIYDLNGKPLTDLRTIHYTDTACSSPRLIDPRPSECLYKDMAEQIVNVVENYVTALIKMTEELSAVMMQHVQGVGMFMDAKMHLQTERELQKLVAQAHKDYHPSDQMCRFGTFVRSVAAAEQKGEFNKQGLNAVMMAEYSGIANAVTAEGNATDIESRLLQFTSKYCDPGDNNGGLGQLCGAGGPVSRRNQDINYSGSFDYPLTLNVDFTDSVMSEDEEDIIALARHLYWPAALDQPTSGLEDRYPAYMNARSLFAFGNVAHNSFASIMAMKSRSAPATGKEGWQFMKILLRDFGLQDEEIEGMMGANPSYYAQMEILTKKIYQDPDFYTNLYDKPANVKRIGVAMDAIKLMQGQDRQESALRREMLSSLLVEQALRKHVSKINGDIGTDK